MNDCAHVLEDVMPFIPQDIETELLLRTRKLWSKTFGLFWKILNTNGNVYHVSYALQDAYLVSKLKHLDVLHCHGMDVRESLKNWKWKRMIRSNLETAKIVLYSTIDLEDHIKPYREDARYFPNPVRTDIFTPKTEYNTPLRALHFTLWYERLSEEIYDALKQNNIHLDVLDKRVPYMQMPETLRQYDIFIDRFTIPSLSKTCLEAMSCGLLTVDYRHSPRQRIEDLSAGIDETEVEANRRFISEHHDARNVANNIQRLWRHLA